ncbi:hypothetical protein [Vulcanisaeta sp. JCM 16159]|uniref:hypothetical protein n=1 Tax=Vulcanisaeta sp. JCM 16159 TaxID=1295371 RepID=UPI001FB45CAC|nr:hypothetical protein [Vulcanisaeta sp. JCM 16159]
MIGMGLLRTIGLVLLVIFVILPAPFPASQHPNHWSSPVGACPILGASLVSPHGAGSRRGDNPTWASGTVESGLISLSAERLINFCGLL